LGDIPILGWLFKNDSKSDAKDELLVFITPKILKESLNLN
jgi:type IV pilus assembly protein PilQ